MLKSTFTFFRWVHDQPEEKIRDYIKEYSKSEKNYIIEDYHTDMIGFLSRCRKICDSLLDEYNTELTDRYFLNKLGEPPYITTAEVYKVLNGNQRAPIELMYSMNDEDTFYYMCKQLPSDDFNDLSMDNLLFKIMERIYENDDSDYWNAFFGDEK